MTKCGKHMVEPGRPQMTIRRMRIACWIPKATNTHSEYVTFIAFLLQKWLYERVCMLRYAYIDCIVGLFFICDHDAHSFIPFFRRFR